MAEKLSYLKRGTAYERINAYARMDYIWLIGGIFNIVFSCDRFYMVSTTNSSPPIRPTISLLTKECLSIFAADSIAKSPSS